MKTPSFKVRTMIYIDKQVFKTLKHFAFDNNMSFSQAVEKAVKEYLKNNGIAISTNRGEE